MSRTRSGDIDPLGAYYTDPRVAAALVEYLSPQIKPKAKVLEPSAGSGAFLKSLADHSRTHDKRLRLYAMDIDAGAPALAPDVAGRATYQRAVGSFTDDAFLDAQLGTWGRPDVVIGNPPFSIREPLLDATGTQRVYPYDHKRAGELRWKSKEVATDHCSQAIRISKRHVLFVLRVGFVGGKGRYLSFWSKMQSDPSTKLRAMIVLVPRPSFTGKGSDSSEYAAFWWDKLWTGDSFVDWLFLENS